MTILNTERLELIPITLPIVEAAMLDHHSEFEQIISARFPGPWPGRAIIERAFSASLERVRSDPAGRLWGDRLMITRGTRPEDRWVVGSVVFHGQPDESGTVEIGYGVESSSQGKGYATEATLASVLWALEEPGVKRVTATTFPWHASSIRVIEKLGMVRAETLEHETLGEMWLFERKRV